jgi:hypothetical protein
MARTFCGSFVAQRTAGGDFSLDVRKLTTPHCNGMIARMTNPYSQPYEKYKGMGTVKGASADERKKREQASGMADLLRMLGGVAPAAGTALGAGAGALIGGLATGGAGALPGAGLGGTIGGALGQMAGGLAESGASSAERPYLESQSARDRQIEMLLSAFGSRR